MWQGGLHKPGIGRGRCARTRVRIGFARVRVRSALGLVVSSLSWVALPDSQMGSGSGPSVDRHPVGEPVLDQGIELFAELARVDHVLRIVGHAMVDEQWVI